MTTSAKRLKNEVDFNIDKIYQQFYLYTAQLKKNRLIDLYHSLFCTLPASSLVKLSHLNSEEEYRVNKNQTLIASGDNGLFEVTNLLETPLYEIDTINYSFNNEKIVISLKFTEEIIVNAESRFRFYLHHPEAVSSVVALSFLKNNVSGSQVIINHDIEFKSYIDYQNIDSLLLCRNQVLRQMMYAPQHFCFFDFMINIVMPYKACSIDFHIELNSHEYVSDIINHLEFNTLTLLGLHQAHANRIYLNDANYYPILLNDQHSHFFELTHIQSQNTDIYPRYLFHDTSRVNYTLHYKSFTQPMIEFHYAENQRVDWVDIECLCHTDLIEKDINQFTDVDEKATFLLLKTQATKVMNYDDRQVLIERFIDINFGNVASLASIQLFFDLLVDKESFIFPLRKCIVRTETTHISGTFVICLHILISEVIDEYLLVYLCKVLQRFINYNFTNILKYRVVYKVLK